MLRKSILGAVGLSLVVGAMNVSSVEAADKPRFKSPIRWLKDRSAESRFKLFSKEHDRTRVEHFQTSPAPFDSGPEFVEQNQRPASQHLHSIPLPSPMPLNDPSIQRVAGQNFIDAGYQNTTSDPNKLKKVTSILPFADYQPLDAPEQVISENLREPEEINLSDEAAPMRTMEATVFQWQPSNLWHNPLYFEDPGLERSGHTFEPWLQPFASVGRFGVQLVGLPYQMTIDPVCKKRYSLGWYRPGECAPKQIHQVPWNTHAAINQALVVTGAVFALP
jgi:hypothetical protein